MNKERRNQLEIILNRLEDVQSDVIKIRDEEEHYRDNISVDLQESAQCAMTCRTLRMDWRMP